MNEQLKRLMYEHGLHKYISEDCQHRMELLCELIVRECIQVCADRGAHHDYLYHAWAIDCSQRIGKHFGVEE